MERFNTLSDFLIPDYHTDYWSDDAVLIAMEMLAALQPDDWDELARSWPDRTPGWQCRLADILDDAPPERAMPILLAMVVSEDGAVAKTAAASLCPYRDRLDPAMVPGPIKDRIRAIAGTSHLMQLALGNLVKKMEMEKP